MGDLQASLGGYCVILALAAVTYGCRTMGHVLMSRLRPTARLERALQVLPGSIIVATIAPSLAQGGPAAWIGVLVSVVTMATTRYDLAALIGGVGAVALIRSAGF